MYVDMYVDMLMLQKNFHKKHPKTDDKMLIAFGDEFTPAVETSS